MAWADRRSSVAGSSAVRRGRRSERVPDKARVQLDHVIRIDRKISGLLTCHKPRHLTAQGDRGELSADPSAGTDFGGKVALSGATRRRSRALKVTALKVTCLRSVHESAIPAASCAGHGDLAPEVRAR